MSNPVSMTTAGAQGANLHAPAARVFTALLGFFDGDNDAQGGGVSRAELNAAVDRRLRELGSNPQQIPAEVREQMAKDRRQNYRLRQERRAYRTALGLKDGQPIPENVVVLSGDDAKQFEELRALGTVDELKEAKSAAAKFAEAEKTRTAEGAAKAVGYNPTVLASLVASNGVNVAMENRTVQVQKDGQTTTQTQTVPVVTRKDANGNEVKEDLTAWVQRDHAAFLPALQHQADGQNNQNGTNVNGTNQTGNTTVNGGGQNGGGNVVNFPVQNAGGGQNGGGQNASVFDKVRESRTKADANNPLQRAGVVPTPANQQQNNGGNAA